MKLYLVRHASSNPPEVDPEKGLSELGFEEAKKVAEWLKGEGVSVPEVFHSGKKRALETAGILVKTLGLSEAKEKAGLAPNDDVEPIAKEVDLLETDLMLVGHLPFMNRLASLLVTGNADADLFTFGAGAVMLLEKEEGKWQVHWMLTPEL